MQSQNMYGYKCECCGGIVEKRLIDKEAFKHKNGFVILENVPVGICNKCGYRYYHSTILKKVEEVSQGIYTPEKVETVPVFSWA
ncbi:MAG: YgiT-type zinc finger protein [Candidatus Poribacteria bacterium]